MPYRVRFLDGSTRLVIAVSSDEAEAKITKEDDAKVMAVAREYHKYRDTDPRRARLVLRDYFTSTVITAVEWLNPVPPRPS
jgi:hypothetical protein